MTQTNPTKKSHVVQLLLVLILAISAYIQFTVVSRTTVDGPLAGDAGEYFSYAYNLEKHGTYSLERTWDKVSPSSVAPDNIRSPGYPLFLLAIGDPKPFEEYGLRVAYSQAALGVLSVWLTFLIAAMVTGPRLALVAALVTATSPQLATISTYLLSESLFCFILLVSVWTLCRAIASAKPWLFAATGIAWGFCALVRPTAEMFPPLLFLAVLVLPSLRIYRRPAILAMAGFLLVLGPWIVRNQITDLKEQPSSLMVNTLAHGSYPGFMYEGRRDTFGYAYQYDPLLGEITKDIPSVLRHIAGHFREEPLKYALWYAIGKPYYFLSQESVQSIDILIYPVSRSPYYEDVKFAVIRRVSLGLHWPLTILAFAGAILLLAFRNTLDLSSAARKSALIICLVVGYAVFLHMAAAPFPRYSVPFRPLLFILALLPLRAAWLALSAKGHAHQDSPSAS